MNPEVKEKWLAALRSGDYTQTRTALYKDGSYCCLGVLCEIAVQEGVPLQVRETSIMDTMYKYYNDESGLLPYEVQTWAGLINRNPNTTESPEGYPRSMAELNDNGWTFEEIADVIERDF